MNASKYFCKREDIFVLEEKLKPTELKLFPKICDWKSSGAAIKQLH